MDIQLIELVAQCGRTLHLAVIPGVATADLFSLVGKGKPIGKVMTIAPGDVIPGVDTDVACNALRDNGWTVFGSGFDPD